MHKIADDNLEKLWEISRNYYHWCSGFHKPIKTGRLLVKKAIIKV